MSKYPDFVIVDDVPFPEGLMDLLLALPELDKVYDPELKAFMARPLTKVVRKHMPGTRKNLRFVTGHVHNGSLGIGAHDHKPYRYTSVLYACDAVGELVVDPHGRAIEIEPREGRLVIMRGDLVHSVNKSPRGEFRTALVSNYAYPYDSFPFFKSRSPHEH